MQPTDVTQEYSLCILGVRVHEPHFLHWGTILWAFYTVNKQRPLSLV